MTSILYEDAVNMIHSMFQHWDKDSIVTIFATSGYHIERTIETILAMDCGGDVNITQTVPNTSASNNADRSVPYPSSTDDYEASITELQQQLLKQSQAQVQVQAQARHHPNQTSSTSSKRRGTPQQLPVGFLQLSSWKGSSNHYQDGDTSSELLVNNLTIGDAELALMLQDELFRAEVMESFGHDFTGGTGTSAASERYPRSRQGPRAAQPQAGARGPAAAPASSSTSQIPDLGILKALQGMGGSMKERLNQLAQSFSSRQSAPANRYDEFHDDAESRPLVASDMQYEEEEEDGTMEMITPVNGRYGRSSGYRPSGSDHSGSVGAGAGAGAGPGASLQTGARKGKKDE